MDINECVYKEEELHGIKVTHVITFPKMSIIGDEVGANIIQKSDGYKDG